MDRIEIVVVVTPARITAIPYPRVFQTYTAPHVFILSCRHLGIEPSREDRFQSDLLRPEAISDTWLRRFTAAAAKAPLPVLLGGHSLVSGGLMALNDAAWLENDRIEGREL